MSQLHYIVDYYRMAIVIILLAVSASANAVENIERVFIFGDSLSDPGNIYALTGETTKAPYPPIPSAPYAMGGHHFSNGKTWAERLAQTLQDRNGGKASLDGPGQNGNYAHGGSRARYGSPSASPSSVEQVSQFLSDFGGVPANSLVIIEFGGNDLRDALVAGATDPDAVIPILQAALSDTATAIQTLYVSGARHFLVANAPNIGNTPVVQMSGASAAATYLVGVYNSELENMLQYLEFGIPNIRIDRLDLAALIDDVVASPGDWGFDNATSPCLSFLVESGAKCDDPEAHFFWDGLHPTATGHEVVKELALAVLSTD
jgi:outer membrane lipase/esterase